MVVDCSVSDPDLYESVSFGRIRIRIRKPLIWIRVASKINQNHGINKSEWFVNVLFYFITSDPDPDPDPNKNDMDPKH